MLWAKLQLFYRKKERNSAVLMIVGYSRSCPEMWLLKTLKDFDYLSYSLLFQFWTQWITEARDTKVETFDISYS